MSKVKKGSSCSFADNPHLLNIGILKSFAHQGTGIQVEASKEHYFVHLSFQEYFAARYLINALQLGPREKAIEFIQHQKYNRRFALLLRFASGLAPESNCPETIEVFWETIQAEPLDLVGIRHMQLVMSCFDEVLTNTDFPYWRQLLDWVHAFMEHILNSENLVPQEHLRDALQPCNGYRQ